MSVDSNCPWVSITPAPTAGLAWRCTKVHHLSGAENNGRRNIFINCVIAGLVIRQNDGLSIEWGWDGQRPDEAQQPRKLDKQPPDPSTDIPIDPGQHIWIRVVDRMSFPSDKVSNLHTKLPSDGPGNEFNHQSYEVTFNLLLGDNTQPPVVPEPSLTLEQAFRQIADLDRRLKVGGL